jgi:hypothetical protein
MLGSECLVFEVIPLVNRIHFQLEETLHAYRALARQLANRHANLC